MAYQSQLVVRTKDRETTQLVEKVKEMADEQGKTYSEMALELLTLGREAYEADGDVTASTTSTPDKASDDDPSGTASASDTSPDSSSGDSTRESDASAESVADAVDWDLAADGKKDDEPPELPGERLNDEELPDADDPDAIAEGCLDQLEEQNRAAAIQILAHFFDHAGPVEGGQVKDKLQEELGESGYETLLEALRQTEEYRAYRKRVIFG